jgi:LysM repeat protein
MSLPKQLLLFLLFLILTSFSSAQEYSDTITSNVTDSAKVVYPHPFQISITDSIINFGKKFLHKPYHYKPNSQIRFDCSGFASYVYSNFGYQLKRSSAEQAEQVGKVELSELKTGDLVFYSGRSKSRRVGHVGIVVSTKENGKFDFIHSSVQSGIVISNSDEAYYSARYIKAGRVINNDSLLNINLPPESTHQSEKTNNCNADENSTNSTSSSPELKETNPAIYHMVKSGDTLYAISRKYGIPISELKKTNHLKSDKIMPGQKLIITDETAIADTNQVK